MPLPTPGSTALSHLRICDFTGQLAGAGATQFLAAVRRPGDPRRGPGAPGHAGTSCAACRPTSTSAAASSSAAAFNNHNVEKLGITHQPAPGAGQGAAARAGRGLRRGHRELRRRRARPHGLLLRRAARDQARHHLRVELAASARAARTRSSRPGARSCRRSAGSRSAAGSPDQPPAGWGFSYMDHMGANYMAVAILAGLIHRNRTGEGQWIDMACTEAGATLCGPDLLDYTVNGRPLRRAGPAQLQPQPRAARWRRTASTRPRATTTGSRSRAVTTTTGPGSPR